MNIGSGELLVCMWEQLQLMESASLWSHQSVNSELEVQYVFDFKDYILSTSSTLTYTYMCMCIIHMQS